MTQTLLYRFCLKVILFVSVLLEFFSNILNQLNLVKTRRQAKLPKSLDGKVVVITGANSGIGKVNAITLAKLGANVVMACRDSDKSRKCFDEIYAQLSDDKKKNLSLVALDLSSLESVRSCAAKINSLVPKIDYLINNAGIMVCPESKSKDGYELQFATNHLGHFLLTNLLLDKIKAAPSARIVNVSAIAHLGAEINFDNINLTGQYIRTDAYAQTKLANVLFTRELAKRLKGTKVTAYAVHPGLIDTDIIRHVNSTLLKILNVVKGFIQISAEDGAQTTLYCALDEELERESGHYYQNCRRVRWMAPHAVNDNDAEKLWKLSVELCDKKKVK